VSTGLVSAQRGTLRRRGWSVDGPIGVMRRGFAVYLVSGLRAWHGAGWGMRRSEVRRLNHGVVQCQLVESLVRLPSERVNFGAEMCKIDRWYMTGIYPPIYTHLLHDWVRLRYADTAWSCPCARQCWRIKTLPPIDERRLEFLGSPAQCEGHWLTPEGAASARAIILLITWEGADWRRLRAMGSSIRVLT
jgi:hypothetical protein